MTNLKRIIDEKGVQLIGENEAQPETHDRWIKFDTEKDKNRFIHLVRDIAPSAQPEKRTDKRTETHTCDLISRQAAIDAHYEYCNKHPDAGFPVWSLKILEDLPSADLSGYSDRLWHNAYERGRAEAQAEIVRCKNCKYNSNTCGNYVNCDIIPQMFGRTTDNFCSRAERRTDG